MNTIIFTQSQAERYAEAALKFNGWWDDDEITVNDVTLKKISEMDYIFESPEISLEYGMYTPEMMPTPIAYVPKNEAEYLLARYSCLIGKTELKSGKTIVDMKAASGSEMWYDHGIGYQECSSWGVFAKVEMTAHGIQRSTKTSEWILFDNTREYNAGIPTLRDKDFEQYAKADYLRLLESADNYMGLRSIFLLYHGIEKKLFPINGGHYDEVHIIYEAKSLWEPYNKWHCVNNITRYNLYTDHILFWVDSDGYSFEHTERVTLFDYLQKDDNACVKEMREVLNCAVLPAPEQTL